jgi:hypothetical protein
MTLSQPQIDEFRSLLARLADGPITPQEKERLNALLAADPRAQQMFADYAMLEACLEMVWTSGEGQLTESCETAEPESVAGALPVLIEGVPDLQAPVSPLYSGGSFLFSYAAAVVIVGIGLLIGWAYQVSIPCPEHGESAQLGPRPMPTDVRAEPKIVFVGRITDTVECRRADSKTGTADYGYVALGQKYALASGLMEITYDTGAKVILQGPCVYKVESRAGGYLSRGRLTARIERKGERGERRGERENSTANYQSSIVNHHSHSSLPSPLSSLPSPLFTVRTPTAKVADLGTEFGVEVDSSGGSVAHVYAGKVELIAVSSTEAEGAKAVRLEKNESARVVVGKDRLAKVVRDAGPPDEFVRQMPRRVRIKLFNTGVHLKDGAQDSHWQWVARSDDPKFKPCPAVVTSGDTRRMSNERDRSQWISAVGGGAFVPDGVTYTFRTTFDLKGMRPSTAHLHGRFAVDNHVGAIRLNGRSIAVPAHGHREFGFFHEFSSNGGFVDGVNVLEIDVENGDPQDNATASMMGLLVELEGSVVVGWAEPAKVVNTK